MSVFEGKLRVIYFGIKTFYLFMLIVNFYVDASAINGIT